MLLLAARIRQGTAPEGTPVTLLRRGLDAVFRNWEKASSYLGSGTSESCKVSGGRV